MRGKNGFVALCRVILALVFIFSGFVKAVDPWGTAIKLSEYFHAFGLGALQGMAMFFSILLSSVEMLLGFCTLFRLGFAKRRTPTFMLIVMAFFTLLTLILAIWNPVSDCGCFGDAVKLTNWQTFFKNWILLGLAVVMWIGNRPQQPRWSALEYTSGKEHHGHGLEWSLGFMFLLFSVGVGLYSLRHLPVIDFLPFQAGTDLTARSDTSKVNLITTLIYKDKTTGENHEFTLSDTTWYDTTRWEFVDTRFTEHKNPYAGEIHPLLAEFSIFDANGDHTDQLLATPSEWLMVTVTDPEQLSETCRMRLALLTQYAQDRNIPIIGVTSAPLTDSTLKVGILRIPLYNMDGTTLKSLIRTHQGVIALKDGVILAKWDCRDIPDFTRNSSILSYVTAQAARTHAVWFIGVCAAVLVLLYIGYFVYQRCE